MSIRTLIVLYLMFSPRAYFIFIFTACTHTHTHTCEPHAVHCGVAGWLTVLPWPSGKCRPHAFVCTREGYTGAEHWLDGLQAQMNNALCVNLASCNTSALLTRVALRLKFKGSRGKTEFCLLGVDFGDEVVWYPSHTWSGLEYLIIKLTQHLPCPLTHWLQADSHGYNPWYILYLYCYIYMFHLLCAWTGHYNKPIKFYWSFFNIWQRKLQAVSVSHCVSPPQPHMNSVKRLWWKSGSRDGFSPSSCRSWKQLYTCSGWCTQDYGYLHWIRWARTLHNVPVMREKMATSIHFCGCKYPIQCQIFLKGHTHFHFTLYSLLER